MRRNNAFSGILVLFLIISVALVPVLVPIAASAESKINYGDYDLSSSGSSSTIELDVEHFVKLLEGSKPVSERELDYIKKNYAHINVRYEEPGAGNFDVTAIDDTVTVTADPYVYTTAKKVAMTWYPISAKIEGSSASVDFTQANGQYVAVIDGIEIDADTAIVVEYKLDFEFVIDKDDISAALNATYISADKIRAEYLASLSSYNQQVTDYNNYLAQKDAYKQYQSDMALYTEALAKYNRYLKALAKYEKDLVAYNEYIKKLNEYNLYQDYGNKYQQLLDEYNLNVIKYEKYLQKMNTIKAQLDVFDTGLYDSVTTVNTAEPLERQLYACIFGDTVDDVVNNKDAIIFAAGKDCESAIDDAGLATNLLRSIFSTYGDCVTEEDKYEFYIANYDAIKSNIILLAQTLFDLYRYDQIRNVIHTGVQGSGGKTDKYVIMVSQLILFANAISDEDVYSYGNSKYSEVLLNKDTTIEYLIGESLPYKKTTKSVLQILEGNEYVKDSNSATPLEGGYPQYMEEPVAPLTPDEIPTVSKPNSVPTPQEPTPVEEPIPPTEIAEPTPVEEPTKPEILDNEYTQEIISGLDSGEIVERTPITEDYAFTPTASYSKKIINSDNVSVTFYGNDRITVLSKVIAQLNSSVVYSGSNPIKDSTATEDYTFSGWIDANGNNVDLSMVKTDLSLYPAYRVTSYAQINFYDTDGTLIYNVRARKGSAVVYTGKTPVKSDDTAVYKFEKWVDSAGNDYNLSAVENSVDLYPYFKSTPYIYVNFYDTDRSTVLHTVKILPGQAASYAGKTPTKVDETAVYTFEKWVDANGSDVNLSSVSGSIDIYPQFTHVDYIYVNFYNADGSVILYTHKILPGQAASYVGSTPTKSDDTAVYTFEKWVDSAGNNFNLSNVERSVDLYPSFKSVAYIYVKFYAADNTTVLHTAKILPGQSALYDGATPEKYDDTAVYRFEKWVDVQGNDFNLWEVNESVNLYPYFKATYYIYVRFYDTDRTTLLYTDKILPGEAASYGLDTTPVKNSIPEADYIFAGWVNANGASQNLSSVTESLDLYPNFTAIPFVNVYFYDTDRVTIIYTARVRPGAQASYTGTTPIKDSVPEADYVFSSWVDASGNAFNLNSVRSSVNLYPKFDSIPYVILKFFRIDGSLITEARVLKGSAYTYSGEIPTKASTSQAEYDFSGWIDADGAEYDFASVGYSASFTPVFDTYIVINFRDESGNILETHRVRPGTEIVYGGVTPEKPAEPEAGYLFTGWKDASGNAFSLSAPIASADLYPVFSVTSYIILDFYDTDGTLIVHERVLKGKAYNYSSAVPAIESTATADYIFIGWKDENGDMYDLNTTEYSAALYPVFETVEYIILNFFEENGTLLETQRVRPGFEVVFGGTTPERPPEPEAGYLFNGWKDADGNAFSLSAPTVSADLYPVFSVTSYIVLNFYDTDGTLIISERILKGKPYNYSGKIPTKASVTEADYEFSHWIDENGVPYNLNTTEYSADLSPAFTAIKCVTLRFYDTDGVTLLETHRVRVGTEVVFGGVDPVKASIPEADYAFSGWQDAAGKTYDIASPTETADLYPTFDAIPYVVINFYDTDGVTLLDTKRVLPGSSLSFDKSAPVKDSIPEADYQFSGWQDGQGNTYDLTSVGYTANLYPTFDVIRYVVIKFYSTDNVTVIDEHRVLPYDMVIFGGVTPTKPATELEDYYFSCWNDEEHGLFDSVISSDTSLNLYPVFDIVEHAIITFYDTDGETVLDTQRIRIGLSVDFRGQLPVKDSIPEADYHFAYWVDENGVKYNLNSVSESIDLYPYFDTVKFVVISFYDTDRVTLLEEHRVRVGEAVTFASSAPVKDSIPEADYVFAGWIDADGNVYDITSPAVSAQLYPYFDVVSYAIVNFYDTDRATILETYRVQVGKNVSFDGVPPVKSTDYYGAYTFSHWVDSDGAEYNLGNVGESVDLYPEFDITPYLDVIFYANDGVTVLDTHRVLLGGAVVYGGEIPVKEIDEYGKYSFAHWVNEDGEEYDLDFISESVELYPYFNLTSYIVITFVGADGETVLDVQKVFPGEAAVYGGEIPLKDSIPEADYTFSGVWLDQNGEEFDLLAPIESVSVYPGFTVTPYIVINFYAIDGTTVLQSLRQRPDQRVVYTGDVPTKDATTLAVYEFKGWTYADGAEYNFERLSESTDFYPAFREIPYITVTFYGADGETVMYSTTVLQGETISYGGETPAKESDSEFAYKFFRWTYADGSEYNFSTDTTASVYPEFTAIPYLTVTFVDTDGVTVLDTKVVLQGTPVYFEGLIPTRESDIVCDYVFDAWVDEQGVPYDIFSVQDSVSLYPSFRGVYKEYELDTNVDGTGVKQFNLYLGDMKFTDIPLMHFVDVAADNMASLFISTSDISVKFSYSQVLIMRKAGVAYASVTQRAVSNGYNCSFVLKNEDGRSLNATVGATLSLNCKSDTMATLFSVNYITSSGEEASVVKKVSGSTVAFEAQNNIKYSMLVKHEVIVPNDLPVGVDISAGKFEPGEIVTVNLTEPVPQGTILALYYYDANSVKHIIEGDTFVMPDGYVLIGVELVDIYYTVTFMSDGKVLSENQYKYGDTVSVPRDPVKQNDLTYSYTFIGWSQEITTVTGDVVYEAQFEAELLPEENNTGIQIEEKYLNLIKTAIVIAVVVLVLTTTLVVVLIRRRFA